MNKDQLKAFWDEWPHPGQYVVLTAISPDGRTETESFDLENPNKEGEFLAWVNRYNETLRWNCYFTVNPVRKRITKKASRSDIAALSLLHCDVDPHAGEDLGKERERILKLLQVYSPSPTAIIDSGNGYQAFFRLKEPIPLDGSNTAADAAALYNKAIELALGADNCSDVSRVMRLPGTTNFPNAQKIKAGRVPVEATLVEYYPERVYPISQFKKAKAPVPTIAQVKINTDHIERVEDLSTLPEKVSDLCRVAINRGTDPDDPTRWSSRSEALFFVCAELARADVKDEVIYSIITDPDFKISASVLDKGTGMRAYAIRQIERARLVDHDLDQDKNGKVYPSIANVRRVLAKEGVRLYYDEFADRSIIEGLDGFPTVLQDDAIDRLWLIAEDKYRLHIGKDKFHVIVADQARYDIRNPVQEYLGSLTWDGTPRISEWLTRYLGVADSPYSNAVGRLVLVAACRRARKPGCKFDEMLVLEGEQGKGKSIALRALAVNADWFTEDLILNADTKKQIEQLSGKWIVEAGELKGMKGRATEFLKSFLSRQIDRARMSYGRLVKEYPRRCIIIGTTNADSYLKDNTGNRRFWPVKTETLNLLALRNDRDQLWAEAAEAEAQGESIRLDETLWAEAAGEQEQRYERDPWADELGKFIGDQKGKVRRDTLWRWLGHEDARLIKQEDGVRLSAAMGDLGFTREKRLRFGGKRPWPGFWRGNKHKEIMKIDEADRNFEWKGNI